MKVDPDDPGTRADQALRRHARCRCAVLHRGARDRDGLPRPERRRQVDHDADDDGAGSADLRIGARQRPAVRRAPGPPPSGRRPAGGSSPPPGTQCPQPPGLAGSHQRHRAVARRPGSRHGGPDRGGGPASGWILPRHGPAARGCCGAPGRPPDADPGRACQRVGPRRDPLDPCAADPSGRRGPDRLLVLPPDERDGCHGRPRDRDRSGAAASRSAHGGVHRGGIRGVGPCGHSRGRPARRAPAQGGRDGHHGGGLDRRWQPPGGSACARSGRRVDGGGRHQPRRGHLGGRGRDHPVGARPERRLARGCLPRPDPGVAGLRGGRRRTLSITGDRAARRQAACLMTVSTEGALPTTPEAAPAGDVASPTAGSRDQVVGRVDGPVTRRGVIASEWVKFRSLRSTLLVLAAAVAGMVVFGAIIAINTRNPAGQDPEDLVASGPLQGYYLGQLLIGALGVLVVSGEYSSGMIRATLAAVPTRLPVLLAKLLVFTLVVGAAMTAASIAGFLVAQAFLSGYRPTFSLSDPDVLRVVVGTGVYLTLIGLLGGPISLNI